MSFRVVPRDGHIVWRLVKEEKRGSIHLPGKLKDTTVKKRGYGVVVAVGPGELKEDREARWPMPFSIGDLILPDPNSPILESEHEDGDTLYISRASDVIADLRRTDGASLGLMSRHAWAEPVGDGPSILDQDEASQ